MRCDGHHRKKLFCRTRSGIDGAPYTVVNHPRLSFVLQGAGTPSGQRGDFNSSSLHEGLTCLVFWAARNRTCCSRGNIYPPPPPQQRSMMIRKAPSGDCRNDLHCQCSKAPSEQWRRRLDDVTRSSDPGDPTPACTELASHCPARPGPPDESIHLPQRPKSPCLPTQQAVLLPPTCRS